MVGKSLLNDPPNEVQMPCNVFYWKANILNLKKWPIIPVMTTATISKRQANLDYNLSRTSVEA